MDGLCREWMTIYIYTASGLDQVILAYSFVPRITPGDARGLELEFHNTVVNLTDTAGCLGRQMKLERTMVALSSCCHGGSRSVVEKRRPGRFRRAMKLSGMGGRGSRGQSGLETLFSCLDIQLPGTSVQEAES